MKRRKSRRFCFVPRICKRIVWLCVCICLLALDSVTTQYETSGQGNRDQQIAGHFPQMNLENSGSFWTLASNLADSMLLCHPLCMYVSLSMCMCVSCVCMCVLCVCMCMCLCVSVCVFCCVCVCVCVSLSLPLSLSLSLERENYIKSLRSFHFAL